MAAENKIAVTSEAFEHEVLKSEKPVLLDFWAPWCTYCRRIEPVINQLAADFAGKLLVGEINVDEQKSLSVQFEIDTIPSLILIKDGEPQGERLVAPGSRAVIENWLKEQGIS